MTVPEYSAGAWTAVVRPGFVALLGPSTASSTVRALWQDAGEGVFSALALLARDGFGGLPPFAVVSVDGQRVHAALRGDVEVVVEVGGRRDVWRSGEVSTWTERVLDGVSDVSVQVEDASRGPVGLPLADGVVQASRVSVALTARDDVAAPAAVVAPAAAAAADEPSAPDLPTAHAPAEPVVGSVDELSLEPDASVDPSAGSVAGTADVPSVEPAVGTDDDHVGPAADEPAEPVVGTADALEAGPVVEEPVAGDVPEVAADVEWDEPTTVGLVPLDTHAEATPEPEVDEHTDPSGVVAVAESFLTWPPAPAPAEVPHAPVPVGGASLDDHDGLTILSSDLAEIREQLPSWAGDEVPGPFRVPAAVPTAARLVLSTGLVVPLDRAVLLGRAPQVARVTNRELPRLITVPSPQQDISRTHAEVRVEGDHVVVTDLDSTNGVHVARPGEGARRLHPGEPSVVGIDEVVDLGDGVTFSVERGS
ncbi:MAG: FHA domain-containing protein [Cellulomonas sp.]